MVIPVAEAAIAGDEVLVAGDVRGQELLRGFDARKRLTVQLANGSVFHGYSFGHPESTNGEVVFNIGMVGQLESLTDLSYAGQILVITYPLVGNYGMSVEEVDKLGMLKEFHSNDTHVRAVVVAKYSFVITLHITQDTW